MAVLTKEELEEIFPFINQIKPEEINFSSEVSNILKRTLNKFNYPIKEVNNFFKNPIQQINEQEEAKKNELLKTIDKVSIIEIKNISIDEDLKKIIIKLKNNLKTIENLSNKELDNFIKESLTQEIENDLKQILPKYNLIFYALKSLELESNNELKLNIKNLKK